MKLQAATSMIETSVWNASSHLTNNLHRIFLAILKGGPHLRNRLLSWIGKCLKSNVGRGKLWNVQVNISCHYFKSIPYKKIVILLV